MTIDYTPQELEMMSPTEREAIGYELHDDKPSVKVDDTELEAANAAKAVSDAAADAAKATAATDAAKAVADAAAAKVVSDAAAVKAAEDATAAAIKAAEPAAAPVAPAPAVVIPALRADKVVSDEEHAAAQNVLAVKFADGDLTVPEFMRENEALTRAKIESDLAVKSGAQSEEAVWDAEQAAFYAVPGNDTIRDDARVHAAMQAQLASMYADPAKQKYTNMQFLNEAGTEVRKLFGIGAVAAPAPAVKPAELDGVTLPKTLAHTPIADANTNAASEFADIDKLDGMDYEFALAAMTPERKARYLAV